MTTLAEIEVAAGALSAAEKRELLLFLAAELRGKEQLLPTPRHFDPEQLAAWVREDEADFRRFREGE